MTVCFRGCYLCEHSDYDTVNIWCSFLDDGVMHAAGTGCVESAFSELNVPQYLDKTSQGTLSKPLIFSGVAFFVARATTVSDSQAVAASVAANGGVR